MTVAAGSSRASTTAPTRHLLRADDRLEGRPQQRPATGFQVKFRTRGLGPVATGPGVRAEPRDRGFTAVFAEADPQIVKIGVSRFGASACARPHVPAFLQAFP
jgi:hypothetical protein